jgi:SAM-dependent methyltransferase
MSFVDPLSPDIVEDTFQHFEALASVYDSYCLRRRKYLENLDEFIFLYAHCHKLLEHLDVGCGTGRLMKLLKKRHPVLRSEGIDLSKSMVRLCNASNLNVQQRNFINYDPGKAYDLITMEFNVFGYLSAQYGPQRTLRQAGALLRPGGVLIFDFINPLCLTYDHLFKTLPAALYRYLKLKICKKPLPVKYSLKLKRKLPHTTFAIMDLKKLKRVLLKLGFETAIQVIPYENSGSCRFLPLFLRSHIIFISKASPNG